jgi:hypothetical protein
LKWYLEVESKRYLALRLHRVHPINKFNINLNQVLVACEQNPWLNDVKFLNAYWMTSAAFIALVDEIKHHPVFQERK